MVRSDDPALARAAAGQGHGRRPAKALTVRQPWASLIVAGVKDVENRTWATAHRGVLWIHAGRVVDPEGPVRLVRGDMPRGFILGSVRLVDVVRGYLSGWAEPDCWHWVLTDPSPLAKPIPAVGKQGLWVPPHIR